MMAPKKGSKKRSTAAKKRSTAAQSTQKRGHKPAPDTTKAAKKNRDGAKRPVETEADRLLPVLLSTDLFVENDDLEPASESVRYIVARAGGASDSGLPKLVAVAAALPGEGTTTISHILSSVLSNDLGIETCRVDLSWGSTSQRGVSEVITGTAELDEVLAWDGRAATLHSGAVNQNERHRLARSEELDKLIAVLAGRFQHVILDIPAILSGSDGLAMMRLVDAYLLVVKHGVTTLKQVQTATDQLVGVELLGSVLNQARTRTPRPLSRWLAG